MSSAALPCLFVDFFDVVPVLCWSSKRHGMSSSIRQHGIAWHVHPSTLYFFLLRSKHGGAHRDGYSWIEKNKTRKKREKEVMPDDYFICVYKPVLSVCAFQTGVAMGTLRKKKD